MAFLPINENIPHSIAREIEEKQEIIKLRDEIRRKYLDLRYSEQKYEQAMEKKFKPLISAITASSLWKQKEENYAENTPFKLDDTNLHYKLQKKYVGGQPKYYLGKCHIKLNDKIISVGGKEFNTTPGLLELLTKKNPIYYTQNDARNYESILDLSGIYKTRYDNSKNLNTNDADDELTDNIEPKVEPDDTENDVDKERNNEKEDEDEEEASDSNTSIEENDVPEEQPMKNSRRSRDKDQTPLRTRSQPPRRANYKEKYGKGEGMPDSFPTMTPFVQARRPDPIRRLNGFGNYVYWNDVNELVDRLVFLHSLYQAGNSSVLTEIYNIEEELREDNIIE